MTDSPHSEIFLAREGQEFGPFSRQQLVDGLQRGDFFNVSKIVSSEVTKAGNEVTYRTTRAQGA